MILEHVHPSNKNAIDAVTSGNPVNDLLLHLTLVLTACYTVGVKGAIIIFQHFDVPKEMTIDHLHCLFLGVTLALMKFWFNTSYSKNSYNIREK